MKPVGPSPLVEAVCEFRYAPSPRWDWTVPGRLFEQLKDEFPETETTGTGPIELSPGQVVNIEFPVFSSPQLVRFKRRDGTALIQVGPGMLAVNHMAVGYSWDAFRTLIGRVRAMHDELSLAPPLSRVGLRYINRLPLGAGALKDVIGPVPHLTGELDRTMPGFYQRLELEHDDIGAVLIVQIGLQALDGQHLAVVDLDMGTRPGRVPDPAGLDAWLVAAHDRVKRAFEATLSPVKARHVLGSAA